MRLKAVIFLVIGCCLCGCSDTEVYSRDYLENSGIIQYCSEYAVTYLATSENGYNLVYRLLGSNEFQPIFATEISSSFYDLDIYNGYLYIINRDNPSVLIYAYQLEGEHDSFSWTPDIYVGGIKEYLGGSDEYLYFSYYNQDREVQYGKLSLALQDFTMIEAEDIPGTLQKNC